MNTWNLLSWNVNGIRAQYKKGFLEKLDELAPDVLFVQETKAHPEQLVKALQEVDGYHTFYRSCDIKKGYSGVGMFSKVEPDEVEYGMGIEEFDEQGRLIAGHFGDVVMWGGYFPNGGRGPEYVEYKLRFYEAFLKKINKQRKAGKKVIFCGDINTAHQPIDLARPKENEQNTGFLPEERAWIDKVIENDYIDTFRHFHPDAVDVYSYWDQKSRARDRNVGWRIDYFFADAALKKRLKGADILMDVMGSDHCPVQLTVDMK